MVLTDCTQAKAEIDPCDKACAGRGRSGAHQRQPGKPARAVSALNTGVKSVEDERAMLDAVAHDAVSGKAPFEQVV